MLPTIALVKDAKTKDYIVGFADLGNNDEFPTDLLEWRIAQVGSRPCQEDFVLSNTNPALLVSEICELSFFVS